MSDTDPDTGPVTEAQPEKSSAAQKLNLFERLRLLFGLSGASIRDDIEDALDDASTREDFSPQERAMLKNVLGLHELRVADIMLPRADIVAVGMDSSLAEVLSVFRTAGHSRLPVHGDTLDDPRGMVHIRDFVDYLAGAAEGMIGRPGEAQAQSVPAVTRLGSGPAHQGCLSGLGGLDLSQPLSAAKILRPVLFVPPSMPALDLLVKMQATRTHMALVIDEYGGTDGLASIEDIVEMVVGDIEDEHDEGEAPKIDAAEDGSFAADARASLEDASSALGIDLAQIADAEEVDTLGGLVTTLAGRVPARGEIVAAPGQDLEFEIVDADPRRVKRIRVHRRGREATANGTKSPKGQTEGLDSPPHPSVAPDGTRSRSEASKAGSV